MPVKLLDSRFAVPRLPRSLAARTPSASPAQRAGYDVSEARGNDSTMEWLSSSNTQRINPVQSGAKPRIVVYNVYHHRQLEAR